MDEDGYKANADMIPSGGRRFGRPARAAVVTLGVIVSLLLLGSAALAWAGYDYSRDYEGRILPGASVAGVNVGGLTQAEAVKAVRRAIRPQLTRSIEVSWRQRTWTVTPKELGARSDAVAAVKAAVGASRETTFLDKVRMRVLGDRLPFERDVAITYPRQGVRGFIQGIAAGLDEEARNAAIDYSSGWVEIVPEAGGRQVAVDKSQAALRRALRSGASTIDLVVDKLAPEVSADSFDKVLLVRIGENKLYLYDDGEITREWPVATGTSKYPTPTGLYTVTELRYMPTWVNPDPEGWGASMPLEIPPGPNNPLGTRAINWSASGIRFHGTSADYSIGYNASHGCVRMHMSDVEELYEMVEVGTPIVSVFVGPWKPLGSSGGFDPRGG